MKKRLDNSIMLRNEQSKKKGEDMEAVAEKLALILVSQIEFNKKKDKNNHKKTWTIKQTNQ